MRPSAKILLPERENIRPTEVADPLKFYYLPFSRGFYTRRLAVVSSMLGKGRAGSLLDIGCGSGIFLKELETKCDRLFAIDIHRKMDFVKSMVEKENIRASLVEGSLTHIPFASKTFNCVVSMSVIEHVRDLDGAFRELQRVCRKDATLILGFPVKNAATDLILKLAYLLLPDAKLDEEHVSDHRQILAAAKSHFKSVCTSFFPTYLPRSISLYCILRIIRAGETG